MIERPGRFPTRGVGPVFCVLRLTRGRILGMKKFVIVYEVAANIEPSQLWPNGDGPVNPTPEDVKREIQNHGGITRVLDAWNLDELAHYEVYDVAPDGIWVD